MRFELQTAPLDPVLQSYVDCRDRVSVIRGPLGSGKTVASCLRIFQHMCQQKPNRQGIRKSRWVAIRNTFPDLMTTTIKDWRELFDELGTFKAGGISPPAHTLKFKLSDSSLVMAEVIFIALDRPMAVKKLRGMQVTGFWLNELKELEKAVVDMADYRHGRYPSPIDGGPSWHGMIGDTNSPDDDHWLYEMERDTKPLGWSFFVQPGGLLREMRPIGDGLQEWTGKWYANPEAENVHNLPPGYYIRGHESKTTEWIAVNLANEYGSVHDGKAIYAEQWNAQLHISDSILLLPDWPIVIGLDFGLTPAAIIGQETPNGALHILDECLGEGMGIQQFVEDRLKPLLNARYKDLEINWVGDPAGNKRVDTDEETVFTTLYDMGIEADAANSNNPTIRWEAVRYFLQRLSDGKPAFRVHPRCKTLIKGFNGGYKLRRIQQPGTMKYNNKADKNKFSHPHDALQYLAMWVKGDYVSTGTISLERPEESRWSHA